MAHQAEPGDLVGGRYRLVLGSGHRWRARAEDSGAEVSLEWARLSSADEAAEHAARFERERTEREQLQAAALRACPDLVFVDDVIADADVLWSVTRLVEGRTLTEDVSAYGPMETETARTIARDLLKALAAAHEAGIVHGALSPATVRLTGDGKALLTGFGTSDDEQAYRAPERDHERHGDLFALGATLHFALTGAPPVLPGSAAGDIGELRSLISRLLAEDPRQRPTAVEALALLEPPPAPAQHIAPPAPSPAPPKPYSVAPVVGLVLVVGVLIAVIIGLGQSESSSDADSDSSAESTYSEEETTSYDETSEYETSEEETSEAEETTPEYDPTEEAFDEVEAGQCLPIYRDTDGEWSASMPPGPVACNDRRAGVFLVVSTTMSADDCQSTSDDYTSWSYTGSSGTTTLCLDRVWVPRYCIPVTFNSDDTFYYGKDYAVECDGSDLPEGYDSTLLVVSVRDASESCPYSPGWSFIADEGSSRVCLARPA
ncbi:Protein kinase domain-containing protein [Saccharopolyspora antimicrobica]|uniref:non-specific serine/threonine protein kinase n=1 Tax=Saccharopolyspora antimicrobica TaxID=455193 RepID=A0A1I4S0B3_9PSEU|nr:hypothetical protein [Saccharopolyspora antimicrobica]RKT89211.1 protein kinase-like protein [Saccharopolyspora antimicrobica]SFM57664.1 Protein kinase domain-containing protein [Saccharopolyspora antimicrobica]